MKKVTDPDVLSDLDGGGPVRDPTLLKELNAPSQLPIPYFRGMSMAFPPSDKEVQAGSNVMRELFRGIPADIVSGPMQFVAGLGDMADEAVRRTLGMGPSSRFASTQTAKARNILAGREGEGPGPITPLVQAFTTNKVVSPSLSGTLLQAIGMTPSTSTPEQDLLVEGGKNAAMGAVAQGVASQLGRRVSKSDAERRLDDIAKREGVDRTYGMQTGEELVKNMESRAERNIFLGGILVPNWARTNREAIDDQFARALWNRAGQKYSEFTQENINNAAKDIGGRLEAPFRKVKDIPFGSFTLQSELSNVRSSSSNLVESARQPVNEAVALIEERLKAGKINANDLNFIADGMRSLATNAYNNSNKGAGDLISKLYSALRGEAIASIPTEAGKRNYVNALKEYANLKVIEDVFSRSEGSARGNIDYDKLRAAIIRNMGETGYSRGHANMADLADLGLSMKRSDVLNEGLKNTLTDPILYTLLNNPVARHARESSPINQEALLNALRAGGLQIGN